MGAEQRRKGERGEGEVVALVRAHGWPSAHRNFGSGSAGHSDVAYGPDRVLIECKRTERLQLRKAWRQVAADAQAATATENGDGNVWLPVLATRWNAKPLQPAQWLAVLPLSELLGLLKAAGR